HTEQENAFLITEMNRLRRRKTAEWEPKQKSETRELRRMVELLSFEKSQAEMEREKLWRELSLCSEQTGVCRDIGGEVKQRLFQLENEYKRLEDVHRQEKDHLRRQVDSRVVPIITQTYRGTPAASVEEVQEYARTLSDGWIETFDMYQLKVEEMEQSIKPHQARLGDLQREKMQYARCQIQFHLEEQLMHMQEKFRMDFSEYQVRKSKLLADKIKIILHVYFEKLYHIYYVYVGLPLNTHTYYNSWLHVSSSDVKNL
uniref:Uncharacterized protein n=1 Tax=Gasterosteus aculeatus aculeatus TaxID=481459 RepID=A0AAQ4RFZ4_GASAC